MKGCVFMLLMQWSVGVGRADEILIISIQFPLGNRIYQSKIVLISCNSFVFRWANIMNEELIF